MSDEKKASISLSRMLLLLLLLLIGFTLAGMYARSQRDAAARAPLVGTWKNENGGFWNLRPSGTARARWSNSPGKILYFDWTFDGNELAIYQYGRRNGFGKWYLLVRRSTIGVPPTGPLYGCREYADVYEVVRRHGEGSFVYGSGGC